MRYARKAASSIRFPVAQLVDRDPCRRAIKIRELRWNKPIDQPAHLHLDDAGTGLRNPKVSPSFLVGDVEFSGHAAFIAHPSDARKRLPWRGSAWRSFAVPQSDAWAIAVPVDEQYAGYLQYTP